MRDPITPSLTIDGAEVATGPKGQLAHRAHLANSARFERRVEVVADGVWSVIGNGISNQNVVRAPDGLIVIDTGECVEDMVWALDALRDHTDDAVAAVIYTHSHYVGGTAAIDGAGDTVPIWGHADIESTRSSVGLEYSAAATYGAILQFGLFLPADGPDALVNVGLGNEFSRSDHPRHTPGFVPPTHTVDQPTTAQIAGLTVELTPAPSDADDSITIHFPELSVCVNNIVWPTLFNVFAIRGEAYRDPRVLLAGIDHVISLGAEHLLGSHGPPISGAELISQEATRSRDAIQLLWDQTVRGVNKGLTQDQLTAFVQLPSFFGEHDLTSELYGIAEHHVRQIHTGLRGWFDHDPANLLPVPPVERADRMVAALGGAERVREMAGSALDADDLRWALDLASMLVRRHGDSDVPEQDGALLARTLRTTGQRTTSANVRNWCLMQALELEGTIDLSPFRRHLFGRRAVLDAPRADSVHALRVMVDPQRAEGVDAHLGLAFDDGSRAGLRLRHCVGLPTDGAGADATLELDAETWADLLSARATLDAVIDTGRATVDGDRTVFDRVVACIDHPAFGGTG